MPYSDTQIAGSPCQAWSSRGLQDGERGPQMFAFLAWVGLCLLHMFRVIVHENVAAFPIQILKFFFGVLVTGLLWGARCQEAARCGAPTDVCECGLVGHVSLARLWHHQQTLHTPFWFSACGRFLGSHSPGKLVTRKGIITLSTRWCSTVTT